ncbi:MAG: hypothetical protein OXC45_01720, partial [Gemmatimonadetes bacterium]|nr:hypothetical protein [Gemmatimonadota bacterium]
SARAVLLRAKTGGCQARLALSFCAASSIVWRQKRTMASPQAGKDGREMMEIKWHRTFSERERPRFDDLPPLNDSGGQRHIYQMSALKNRFLIVDENSHSFTPNREQILDLAEQSADWDQLLTTKTESEKQIATRIWNRDGSRAENCGNGVRCLATLQILRTKAEMQKLPTEIALDIIIENNEPLKTTCLVAPRNESCHQAVISCIDTNAMTHEKIVATAPAHFLINEKINDLQSAAEVSYGNPHLVLFLDDSTSPQKEALQGGKLEADLRDSGIPFYRRGVNISFAQIRTDETAIKALGSKAEERIDLQVWERGAGLIGSCGSGAAATWYAAFKQELIKNNHRSFPGYNEIFNARHAALKPINLEPGPPYGDRDLNAFHAVLNLRGETFYLIGNSQIERAGTLTL